MTTSVKSVNTEFKGMVDITGKYTSNISCLEAAQLLISIIPTIDLIVKDCQIRILNMTNSKNLTNDDVFALALYTYELEDGEREENFYYQLNKMLQKRSVDKMKIWSDYLFHLQNALSRLPNKECQVYRGIPFTHEIVTNYKLGRRIYFTAFTSTTSDKSKAMEFAGTDGVVLSIHVFTGKSIKEYSMFPEEEEILLSPNVAFSVSKSLFKEGDTQFVELIEEHPDGAFVF